MNVLPDVGHLLVRKYELLDHAVAIPPVAVTLTIPFMTRGAIPVQRSTEFLRKATEHLCNRGHTILVERAISKRPRSTCGCCLEPVVEGTAVPASPTLWVQPSRGGDTSHGKFGNSSTSTDGMTSRISVPLPGLEWTSTR